MLQANQSWAVAVAVLSLACSGSGGGGGVAPDAGLGGGGGAQTGGTSSGGAGGAADAAADAHIEGGDALPPLDPNKACDLPLETSGFTCKSETPASQPVLGGPVPEGIFDRTIITSPVPASTCDATSSLLLQGGVYKLLFGALGGPFISGGSYTVDQNDGRLIFTSTCGDNNVGYFYEWNATAETLTLFPDNFTGWVYELRH